MCECQQKAIDICANRTYNGHRINNMEVRKRRMIYLVLVVLGIVSVKCLGYWIGLLVTIRWMEINHMPQPSDKERNEITRWVIANLVKDLRNV